jgi:broad specificity phosphatase PhoE
MEKKNQEIIFTRLFLIRHGLTEWNTKRKVQGIIDTHLNQKGIQQAIALSQRLINLYPIDQIYASPSSRALKTAELINEKYKVNLKIDSNLLEVDFGDLANHSIDSLDIEQPEYHQKFTHFISTNREKRTPRPEIPGGERITHIEARIKSFTEKILAKHRGQHIAAVSHGGFIKCLITYFSGSSLENFMPYWVDNSSLSIIDFYGDLPIIRAINDTSHINQPLHFSVPHVI